jgi:hypothetical protein
MVLQRVTRDCSVKIGDAFRRRVKDGDLCLYDKGRTVWIAAYRARGEDPIASVAELYQPGRKPDEEWERREDGTFGRAYLMFETTPDQACWTLTSITASRRTIILMSFYFEDERELEWAVQTWHSLRFSTPRT